MRFAVCIVSTLVLGTSALSEYKFNRPQIFQIIDHIVKNFIIWIAMDLAIKIVIFYF